MNVGQKSIEKTSSQLPINTFPFAVPTLGEVQRQVGFSVDWCTYKLLKYEDRKWSTVCNLR